MSSRSTYPYSAWSIWLCLLCSLPLAWLYRWQDAGAVNLFDGDARYYYYYLQSAFIDPSLAHYDWLQSASPVTHHPAGLALLWLPFFLIGHLTALLFHFPANGESLPYQVVIAVAGLSFAMAGLVYLRRLLQLNLIPDKSAALTISLLFLGTNLLHYTLHEASMSHVYSFALITAFMYYSCRYVKHADKRSLLLSALLLGLIVLVRPNNGLVVFSLLFWFGSWQECRAFFGNIFRSRDFYLGAGILLLVLCIQPLIWLWKEHTLFADRYASYGFYWLHPAFFKMLFGFNAGFFVYAPLCLLFMMGLAVLYKQQRFFFFSSALFVLTLFYFFSAYSAYTYYDGFGIRVLIDYYALFALFGAKLFGAFEAQRAVWLSLSTVAFLLMALNLVYCYQSSHRIMLRAGMTFRQWKYIFLKTGTAYEDCLGGSNDLMPYSAQPATVSLSAAQPALPYDFSKQEYGVSLSFDSIGFRARRICMKFAISRREQYANASREALVCTVLEDKTGNRKAYTEFRLNETPATGCCDEVSYQYTTNMEGDFHENDRISVYLWNRTKAPFSIRTFSVNVYHYNP